MPEKTISFEVYSGSQLFMDIVDAELPNVEYMSETLSGAGIAGEIDSPTIGHTGNMSVKMKFRAATSIALNLVHQSVKNLRSVLLRELAPFPRCSTYHIPAKDHACRNTEITRTR